MGGGGGGGGGADKDDGKVQKAVTVRKSDSFPHLDMEMCWSEGDELHF